VGVYIVEADLLRSMPVYLKTQLMDDDHDGVADAATIAAIIDWAEGKFRQIVGTTYDLPGSAADREYVVSLITDLAWYNAHKRLHRMSEEVRDTYDDAIKELEAIRDSLQGGDLVDVVDVRPARVASWTSATPVMGSHLELM
jgi:phage gp36-like protein